jgi:hypothetical protein
MGNPGLFQELPDIAALLSEGGGDGEQACSADGAVGRLDTMTDLALDDGRPQRSLGSVVGGLDSLSLQEGPQRISHLQELLAGAHRAGPWRSLAALNAQLHHLLERGYRCAEVFDYKRQPDRLAAVLQCGPVDRSAFVAVPLLKQLLLQLQQLGSERCAGTGAPSDGGEITDQMGPAELALLAGQVVVSREAIANTALPVGAPVSST